MHPFSFAQPLLAAAPMLAAPAAQTSWDARGEFGLVVSRGNADATTATLKLDGAAQFGRWKHLGAARLLYGQANGIEAAERWEAGWQIEMKLEDRPFIFGAVRYERDAFGGFAYQGTASMGMGFNMIDTRNLALSSSLGAGYRMLQSQQLVRGAAGEVIERIDLPPSQDAVIKAALNYRWQLSDTTTLSNTLTAESGANNTLVQSDLSLHVAMTKKLAIGFVCALRHNARTPAGLEQTDRLTTVNLVYRI